jgi:TusA-related sulfurtransferase
MQKADKEIDVCGSCCPMPLISVRKAVAELKSGQTLQVAGDDPIFVESVRDLCEISGFKIIKIDNEGRKSTMLIQI